MLFDQAVVFFDDINVAGNGARYFFNKKTSLINFEVKSVIVKKRKKVPKTIHRAYRGMFQAILHNKGVGKIVVYRHMFVVFVQFGKNWAPLKRAIRKIMISSLGWEGQRDTVLRPIPKEGLPPSYPCEDLEFNLDKLVSSDSMERPGSRISIFCSSQLPAAPPTKSTSYTESDTHSTRR